MRLKYAVWHFVNLKTINIVCACFKRLKVALKSVPSINLFCKDYLGRIGLRPVFDSSFFPQCSLRMELIWFCPMLKDGTMPKPAARNTPWCFFTNMGMRVLVSI